MSLAPFRHSRLDQSGFDSPSPEEEEDDNKTGEESLLDDKGPRAEGKDMGSITPDLELEVSRLRRFVKQDADSEWQTIKVTNGVMIEAQNPQPLKLVFSKLHALLYLLVSLIVYQAFIKL